MRAHTHTTLSQIHFGCNKTKCGTNESFDALVTCVCSVMKKNYEAASVSSVFVTDQLTLVTTVAPAGFLLYSCVFTNIRAC